MTTKRFARLGYLFLTGALIAAPIQSSAWGGLGHRTVAAVAAQLLPKEKVDRMNQLLSQLELDNNFVDAASYPDEYVRDHDPHDQFRMWHFADLPDDPSQFKCNDNCLYFALKKKLDALGQGPDDKQKAVALAWVIHLVGDLHQPLHMIARDKGGNDFDVSYRGKKSCRNSYAKKPTTVELHSAWDTCIVEELAAGLSPPDLAKNLLGNISTYKGRPEAKKWGSEPWLAWGLSSHSLAESAAFDGLTEGDDLVDAYLKGRGKALSRARIQLRVAGVRLAKLLDERL